MLKCYSTFCDVIVILCRQDFDPVMYVLEHIPSDEDDLEYYENKVGFCSLDVLNFSLKH